MPAVTAGFELDPRIERDTEPLMWLGLCELRVMNDRRWPWLMLVPQRVRAVELHDLTPLDQTMLTFEADMVSKALKETTSCRKINIAALGNVVPQLHVHLVARNEGDPGWPGPVWGYGQREPYRREDLHQFIAAIKASLSR
ncbi:HIT family protein [Mesorhizobium sp. CAU 1741]|uniref:HIT family protein n=1 Tax=Mesorhizobium sp. CAU 1741 TaxID=3140366 RepID=UPI00325B7111